MLWEESTLDGSKVKIYLQDIVKSYEAKQTTRPTFKDWMDAVYSSKGKRDLFESIIGSDWRVMYVDDKENFVELYHPVLKHWVKYVAHRVWVENKEEVKIVNAIKKCTCLLRELMMRGCRCGGK